MIKQTNPPRRFTDAPQDSSSGRTDRQKRVDAAWKQFWTDGDPTTEPHEKLFDLCGNEGSR